MQIGMLYHRASTSKALNEMILSKLLIPAVKIVLNAAKFNVNSLLQPLCQFCATCNCCSKFI